jgi:NAD(P)-dependent dehydrogenase (short-subunit alcohol dehydrogenase family)
MAEPVDVADVCVFLASPLAAYVTGANVVVHGGGEAPAYMAAARNTSTSGERARPSDAEAGS